MSEMKIGSRLQSLLHAATHRVPGVPLHADRRPAEDHPADGHPGDGHEGDGRHHGTALQDRERRVRSDPE